ncbi:hypothetical protein MASR2M8_00450 [Opitutaceae bacterium]
MNVIPDHRARAAVAGLAKTGDSGPRDLNRGEGPRLHRTLGSALRFWVAVIGFAALSVPAQEAATTTNGSGSASATTSAPEGTPRARRGAPDDASRTATPVLNPLEDYLADWMRPRDHALLRKDAVAPSATESWRRLATTPVNPAARKPAATNATTNPYIAAMNAATNPPSTTSAASTPQTPAPTGPLNPAPPPAPASLAEPEAPLPPPATRYRPPPSSDAKYFPQLKRF